MGIMVENREIKYSAACNRMAAETVRGIPHIAHSLPVLKEHFLITVRKRDANLPLFYKTY
jgi:hypothetical protein